MNRNKRQLLEATMTIKNNVHKLKRALPMLLFVQALMFVTGCVGNRSIEAPAVYLSPAGWQNNAQLLTQRSYDDYIRAVTGEVRRFRIPFDAARAEAEISLSSPAELPPAAHCGESDGIAILVHGLADTAFSLRDIGKVLTEACYTSRLILLPGHGTRAGDLLTTRLSDWQATVDYVIDQAVAESDTVMLVGFSLGAVLTLDAALQRPSDIAGVIGISPAYYLSSARLARWTPVIAPFMRWVDRGVADDPLRYEAMPTRGVAETWRAMKRLEKNMKTLGPVRVPWMLAQSMADAVVVPERNESLWQAQAINPDSRLIRFGSDAPSRSSTRIRDLPGSSETERVLAITHLAVHQSPENPHYGRNGRYRNCGQGMPRDAEQIRRCLESDSVWYGLWDDTPLPGQALAYSTFNPSFVQFAAEIRAFAGRIAARDE